MDQSRHIRADILARRDALPAALRHSKSQLIWNQLQTLPAITEARTLFIYVHFRSEVQTRDMIAALLTQGKVVTVPLTRVAEKRLDAVSITDPDHQLIPGYCSIPEPSAEYAADHTLQPGSLDTILLPGSVFDHRGGRYGYGGGYYDRLLATIPQAIRIGLAFDLQLVERLQLHPHDALLDVIVTESQIIHGNR